MVLQLDGVEEKYDIVQWLEMKAKRILRMAHSLVLKHLLNYYVVLRLDHFTLFCLNTILK